MTEGPTVHTAADWVFRRPDLQKRSQPLRELAEQFEPRFVELRVRRGGAR